MSTDLYGVRVLQLDPEARRVRLRVFVVYYDTHGGYHQPLPEDASFFFRVLWDEADARFGGGGSLGCAVSVEQICDDGFVDANAFRIIERIEQIEARNHPVTDYSNLSDFYYERGGSWQDEEELVQADYDVWVTDARWLDHLWLGQSWGTTSYETQADVFTLEDAPLVPDLGQPDVHLRPYTSGEREEGGELRHELMWQLARSQEPPAEEDWRRALRRHGAFLAGGGGGGSWQTLDVSGLVLAIYMSPPDAAQGEDIEQAVLRHGNLEGVDCQAVDLSFADLTGCWAPQVSFGGANLEGCSATDAWMVEASFEGANLQGADLSRSRLRGANFRGADLRGADLEGCDVEGADFTGAQIGGIKLSDANIRGVKGFGG